MRKVIKSYLLNLSEVERAFVGEMARRSGQKVSQYFRGIISEEMRKHPDVVETITGVKNEFDS